MNGRRRGRVSQHLLRPPMALPSELRARLEPACRTGTDDAPCRALAQAAHSPLAWRSGEAFRRFARHETLKKVVVENDRRER